MKINLRQENILARMEWPGSAHQLALFRIFLGLQVFYSAGTKLFQLSDYVDVHGGTQNIFPAVINQVIAEIAVPHLQIITQGLSIFLLLGCLTKYILPILSVSFLVLFSFYYERNNAPIPWLYIWFPLILLNFTRCSDVLSVDRYFNPEKSANLLANAYRWPMEVVAAWFAYIYVAAGISKLPPIYKGLRWMEGGTSRDIMYNRFLDSNYFYFFGKPLFDYTEHTWAFAMLSVASILVEVVCILILFTHRYHALIISLVLCMHLFLYFIGVMGFMQLAIILSIALIQPGFFNRLFREGSATVTTTT